MLAARQAVPVLEDATPGIPSGWRVAVIGLATAIWRIPAPQDMGEMPARRWDDAALADLEAYSAECERRSAADARLHARLWQVAGICRARFEVEVALREGLRLPSGKPVRTSKTNEKARCTKCSGLSVFGRTWQARTADQRIKSPLLYQLS